MSSPEHPGNQLQVFHIPDTSNLGSDTVDRPGLEIAPENPSLNHPFTNLPISPETASSSRPDQNNLSLSSSEFLHAPSQHKRNIPPAKGGAPNNQTGAELPTSKADQSNRPLNQTERDQVKKEYEKMFTQDKKRILNENYKNLSDNGKMLYSILLGDTGWRQGLPELADIIGMDLNAGLEELRQQGILDESDPTIYLLKRE